MIWPWKREKRAQAVSYPVTARDLTLVEYFDGDQHFGQRVNAVTLEWLSASTAAIDAIAGTIASLPAYTYRVTDNGRQEDQGHPLTRIVRDGPNENQTWPDFAQWLVAECLRHGNGLAEKLYDDRGGLYGLMPMPWERTAAKILTNGRLVYDYTSPFTNQRRRLLDTEVMHLRDRSDDGLIGRARSSRAHPVIAAALALQEFAGSAARNGAYPSGMLQAEGKLSNDSLAQLKERFKELFSGPRNAASAMVLDQGIKWNTVSASLEDMELLAARRFAVEEAARLYAVPSPIVNDHSRSTFTNSESLIRYFAQSTISLWCTKIEAELHRSAFSDAARRTHKFEIDLSGLLRGDPETRWKSHQIAVANRILTRNEIRDAEGYNPLAGGDDFDAPQPTETGATST
jgi:HK97 family phage portal protein